MLNQNIKFLSGYSTSWADRINASTKYVTINDLDPIEIYIDEECVSENFELDLSSSYSLNVSKSTRKICSARILSESEQLLNGDLASKIIGSNDPLLIHHLPLFHTQHSLEPQSKDILLIGSFALVSFCRQVQSEPSLLAKFNSITVVESCFKHLNVSLNFILLEELVSTLKQLNIRFHIILSNNLEDLKEETFGYFSVVNPMATHGLTVAKSFSLDPCLVELDGWLSTQTGFGYRFIASLGFVTDEINQIVNAFRNSQCAVLKSLETYYSDLEGLDKPFVVTGGGPSLDNNLSYLKENSNHFYIVAAGSSINSLLENDIVPDAFCILERSEQVYEALLELDSRYKLSELNIKLISSLTVDSRISSLFSECYFFQRPLSAASSLLCGILPNNLRLAGPEVANVALEVVALSHQKLPVITLGCDFASLTRDEYRSRFALGESPRFLNEPVLSSIGTTVYSDHMFLLARQSLEVLLDTTSSFNLYRVGVGASIKGEKFFNSLSDALQEIKRTGYTPIDHDPYTDSIDQLIHPVSHVNNNNSVLQAFIEFIPHHFDQLLSAIQNSTTFDRQLAETFALYMMSNDLPPNAVVFADDTQYLSRTLRRTTKEFVYSASQYLYDSSPDAYSRTKALVIESFQSVTEILCIITNQLLKEEISPQTL